VKGIKETLIWLDFALSNFLLFRIFVLETLKGFIHTNLSAFPVFFLFSFHPFFHLAPL